MKFCTVCLAAGISALSLSPRAATPSAAPPGTYPVTLSLGIELTQLHPDAVYGMFDCNAMVAPKDNVDSEIEVISPTTAMGSGGLKGRPVYNETAYDKWFGTARNSGQEIKRQFPIVEQAYSGVQTLSFFLPVAGLADMRRNSPPQVVVGCWLYLNGLRAETAAQTNAAAEIALPTNIIHVQGKPFFIVSAPLPLQ